MSASFVSIVSCLFLLWPYALCRKCNESNKLNNLESISISSFVSGSIDTKKRILQKFDNAFSKYGVVELVDHDIPSSLSQNIFNFGYDFFKQSIEHKMKYYFAEIGSHGYQPIGSQNVNGYKDYNDTDNLNEYDLLESFNIYSNYKNMIEMQAGHITIPSFINMPYQLTQFNMIQSYWSLIRQLLNNIHLIASQSLGFEENNNIFEKNMTSGHMHIRLAHYIGIDNIDDIDPPFVRFGAHRDYSGFTIIHNQNINGLQIYYNNTWHSIQTETDNNNKDRILLVGGEFIQFWTNNYWKSALHRVVSKSLTNIEPRKTIITFTSPNMDNIIDILPECDKCIKYNKNIRIFEPVNGIKWVNDRVQNTKTVTTTTMTTWTSTTTATKKLNKYPWENGYEYTNL